MTRDELRNLVKSCLSNIEIEIQKMKELENKAEKYANEKEKIRERINNESYNYFHFSEGDIQQAYKDGYEQGQKDFDTDVTKLLNSYGVTFIDTNSIGGLIALHQLILDIEKENEELKERLRIESQSLHEQCEIVSKQVEQIEKMKCCGNCTKKYCHSNNAYYNYCINNNKCKWELNCLEKPNS